MKLRFTREFERESDQLGAVFVTRVGYDPSGITRFFDRILTEQRRHPVNIPPYLFSHPDVEERIAAVEIAAENLRPTRTPDPGYAEVLADAQIRLVRERARVASARLQLLRDAGVMFMKEDGSWVDLAQSRP